MSATTRGPDDLQTCSLCQRRYNINVYQRHITENQCIKRNQHRLPFQSIKQRTIRIGDRVFSVQQQIKHESFAPTQLTAQRDQQKQLSPAVAIANTNNNYRPSLPRVASINRRQATLAQAKLLLERRTKYQPPWIQKRSNADGKISSIIHQTSSVERASPPRTLFPTDDLPIRRKSSSNEKQYTTLPSLDSFGSVC